ncbi:MAG TPA: PrgI family protein [Symbiobacteriaceae bacterium]|nr:PrgI family protein [Symbiobacteriaceae bacterium]
MPNRAFVPVPLIEAQPRVYKSFRGRQLKGIALGLAGAAAGLAVVGARDIGYAVAFLLALPGFAYGYYRPEGRPVEYWLRLVWRFYSKPQVITASTIAAQPRWRLLLAQIDPIINAMWRMRRRGARG